jgi:hypothetical protein
MRFPKRDLIATAFVAAAGVLYVLWATGSTLPGMSGTRVTGVVVLALGFAASATAVVPGFDDLMRGNKVYLAVTSLIGLVAFIAGVVMLLGADEAALGLVMGAMAVLWAIATIHHGLLAEAATRRPQRTTMQGPHGARIA